MSYFAIMRDTCVNYIEMKKNAHFGKILGSGVKNDAQLAI